MQSFVATNQNYYRSDVLSLGGELLQIEVSYHAILLFAVRYGDLRAEYWFRMAS